MFEVILWLLSTLECFWKLEIHRNLHQSPDLPDFSEFCEFFRFFFQNEKMKNVETHGAKLIFMASRFKTAVLMPKTSLWVFKKSKNQG